MADEKGPNIAPGMGGTPEDAYPDLDATIALVMGESDDGGAEPEPQDEQPEPESEVEETEDGPGTDDSQDDEGDDDPAPEQPEAAKGEVEKARKAAKLAGLPKSFVESASEEDLLTWYDSKLKNDSDVRRAFQENADLRRQLEELQGAKGAEHEAVSAAPEDLSLPDVIEGEIGADASRALVGWFQKQSAPLVQAVQELRAANDKLSSERLWSGLTQGEGAIDAPAGAFDRVYERACELARTKGEWTELQGAGRVQALLKAASRLEFPDMPSSADTKRRETVKRARRSGTATSPQQRRRTSSEAKSPEATTDALIAKILAGENDPEMSPMKLAREFGSLG